MPNAKDEIRRILDALPDPRSLRKFPNRGRVVPEVMDEPVRELFVKRYRLIYEIHEGHIAVLAFIHGARRFPSDLR